MGRSSDMGDYLRARRNLLDPRAVGFPVDRHRRVTGLRREEVAQLAGLRNVVELPALHLVMHTHPQDVADVIESAVQETTTD